MKIGTNMIPQWLAPGAAIRQCLRVAVAPAQVLSAGEVVLRAVPTSAKCLAGWVANEFSPEVLTGAALRCVPHASAQRVGDDLSTRRAASVLGAALRQHFGSDYATQVHHPSPRRINASFGSVVQTMGQRKRHTTDTADVPYGPHGSENLLDIWRSPDLPKHGRAPVLIYVPGGAWMLHDKRHQGFPLMHQMVESGWICVSINYRRSPMNAWPAHIIDVKRAIAWVREHIAAYGGDPNFIAIAGGSAGGHLSSLAALTANDPRWQPGFEDADTSVAAVVPSYGIYDLTRPEKLHDLALPLLEHFVLRARYLDNPTLFEEASPISHVHRDAPPFFVLSGASDALVPGSQADTFSAALRRAGAATVVQADLPNAPHAFDVVATVRCQLIAQAIGDFLGITYGRHLQARRHPEQQLVGSVG